jgi:hypothetical protein
MKKTKKIYTYIFVDNVKLPPNSNMKRHQRFLVCDWTGEDAGKRLAEIREAFLKENLVSRDTVFRIGQDV